MQVRYTAIPPSTDSTLGGELLEVEETTEEVTRPLVYTSDVTTIPIPCEGKSSIHLGEGLQGLLRRVVDTWGSVPVGGEAI